MESRSALLRYAWLSIAAALVTIALKGAAWWMTASVGLLSDALESFVAFRGRAPQLDALLRHNGMAMPL